MFGVLAVNKPRGLTSRDVVVRVAKRIAPHRVGHTGTLDPMATGVLLLAIGHATRLVEFSHLQTKQYAADFWLGKTSDTLDADGTVEDLLQPPLITQQQLHEEAARWVGDVQQTPPRFSAVHINGKRAYDLARKGKEFSLPTRTVRIEHLQVTDFHGEAFSLAVTCGTGTYIRSLGVDIARRLGSDAVMSQLTRTQIGEVPLEQCIALDQLSDRRAIAGHLRSAHCLLSTLPRVVLDSQRTVQIRHGIPLELDTGEIVGPPSGTSHREAQEITSPLLAVTEEDEIVAILTGSGRRYRSLRVFQATQETAQPSMNSSPHNPES